MKKILCVILSLLIFTACSKANPTNSELKHQETKDFSAEYEIKGTTSSGVPKSDTFIFKGTTTNGIITDLVFDIIRNKGTEKEYSKKDIMGYLMNISDAEVEKTDTGFRLVKITAYGYDEEYDTGKSAQFMVSASVDNLTTETKFKDLKFKNDATQENLSLEKALIAFKYVANEAGITDFNEDTLVKELVSKHGLYENGNFKEGNKRISFAGYNGGRSYGEQIDAIVEYILQNQMTLEEVLEMFKTENQMDTPVKERDLIAGATISFVGDFQRMVYLAINGKLFEGVLTHTKNNETIKVEVVTQGYGGEIETNVTFDKFGKIIDITVRDSQETTDIGGVLTQENSKFIQTMVEKQDNMDSVDVVSGATITSESLIKAVKIAQKYVSNLN